MKTKDELKREYKERTPEAGVYLITNTANGKSLLHSSLNLHGKLKRHEFVLSLKSHWNKALQADWNQYGAEKFKFEILEQVKVTSDPNFNLDDELKLLEEIWIEKLKPFDGNGYNDKRDIREP